MRERADHLPSYAEGRDLEKLNLPKLHTHGCLMGLTKYTLLLSFIQPSIRPPIYFVVYRSFWHLSSTHSFIHPPIYYFIRLLIHSFIHPFSSPCSIHPSTHPLLIHPSIHPSVHPSIHPANGRIHPAKATPSIPTRHFTSLLLPLPSAPHLATHSTALNRPRRPHCPLASH